MTSILDQAEAIRDETVKSANTPERVGTCLVDIANMLASATARINSGSIAMNGDSGTVLPASHAPVEATGSGITTGTGITISEEASPDYLYFSGLDSTHAYKLDFSLGIESGTADIYAHFQACNFAGDQINNDAAIYIPTAGRVISGSFTQTITGSGTCVLYVFLTDRATGGAVGATVQIGSINIILTDLGVAVP